MTYTVRLYLFGVRDIRGGKFNTPIYFSTGRAHCELASMLDAVKLFAESVVRAGRCDGYHVLHGAD